MCEAPATRTPPYRDEDSRFARMQLTHYYSVVQEHGEHAQFDIDYVMCTVTVTYCSYLFFVTLTSTRPKVL